MIDPEAAPGAPADISGTSGNYICVRAVNEGMVNIDGQHVRKPIRLYRNNYIIVQGVTGYDSSSTIVQVSADFTTGRGIGNVIRRVVGWNNSPSDGDIFSVQSYASDTLIEDCVAFGIGRKVFGNIIQSVCFRAPL